MHIRTSARERRKARTSPWLTSLFSTAETNACARMYTHTHIHTYLGRYFARTHVRTRAYTFLHAQARNYSQSRYVFLTRPDKIPVGSKGWLRRSQVILFMWPCEGPRADGIYHARLLPVPCYLCIATSQVKRFRNHYRLSVTS